MNRAFNAMHVKYSPRPDPAARKAISSDDAERANALAETDAASGHGRGHGRGQKSGSTAVLDLQKIRSLSRDYSREPADVQVSREMCMALKRSKKLVLGHTR